MNSFIHSKRGDTSSLDDLIEENHDIKTESRATDETQDNDEEDELDAYMASLQQETKSGENLANRNRNKKPRLDSTLDDSDDDNLEPGEEKLEDLEADLAAVIAGANSAVNKTTKKLNQLTKTEIKYPPFRKEFYVEVPELTKLTEADVIELRKNLENIKVVGKSCPKPVTCWAQCGLSRKIMDVLKKLKFSSPTPIQAQAIPAIMSGRDVIGIAKTGCGKTLSFLLPMFRHILDQPKLERGDGPIGLVITPTRELATQICDDATKFTKVLGIRVAAIYGGPNISEQIGMLKLGAEIVVCTPGRMIEILTVNSGRVTNLNRCTILVLDEADRLFDMGFEKQIRSIVDLIRPDRQTVMFSATFPKIMEAHARRILTKPIEIQVGGRSIVCKDVHQTVEIIEEDDKFLRLIPILQKHVGASESAIVFVSKQEKADSLLEDLMQAYDPNCLVLHGGIDKDDRMSTFASFKGGQAKVLVATSVAARGLDVKNCICVVNYDCPNHYEDYVHRCGRTGRAGNKGFAYTFITPEQGQYAPDIIRALELSGNPIPKDLQNLWDSFKSEAELMGKKIWTTSGFSGRGFKFDEAEAQLVNEKKKYQKKSLGLQNSDDEDEDGVTASGNDADADTDSIDAATLESEIKSLAGGKATVSKPIVQRVGPGSRSAAAAAAQDASKSVTSNLSPANNATTSPAPGPTLSKLELFRQRATAMLMQRKGIDVGSSASAAITSASSSSTSRSDMVNSDNGTASAAASSSARQAAEQVAHALRMKLAQTGAALPSDLAGPEQPASTMNNAAKERYEAKFEINDYNQQVRRRLTSKEALAKISEHCEVGITVRGKFCAPGDRPLGPKLYLAIEGNTEVSVERAHRELMLLVKDEYTKINSQPASRGRYRLL